jgi:hypothetical protein
MKRKDYNPYWWRLNLPGRFCPSCYSLSPCLAAQIVICNDVAVVVSLGKHNSLPSLFSSLGWMNARSRFFEAKKPDIVGPAP